VTPALLCYSYCIAGTLIGIGCIISYFSVFSYHELYVSDLLFTANHHWTRNATVLKSSKTGVLINASHQVSIYEQACAAWQICLVFSQIFNLISVSTRRASILKHGIQNSTLIIAILVKLFILFVIIFVPPIQSIVGVQPPPLFVWAIPFGVGLLLLLVNEIRKHFIRRSPNNAVVKLFKW
jgi:sodium/potassium-transporting ATPase subunit alpha